MPTYEYECLNCANRFETFQKMTEQPITSCPSCGGTVKRLIGCGAGIIFKGSGFFVTDYKRPKDTVKENIKDNSDSCSKKTDKKCSGCCESA